MCILSADYGVSRSGLRLGVWEFERSIGLTVWPGELVDIKLVKLQRIVAAKLSISIYIYIDR